MPKTGGRIFANIQATAATIRILLDSQQGCNTETNKFSNVRSVLQRRRAATLFVARVYGVAEKLR